MSDLENEDELKFKKQEYVSPFLSKLDDLEKKMNILILNIENSSESKYNIKKSSNVFSMPNLS